MKLNCIDKKMGALLAAFELGVLSEDKIQQFELHLMECTYCASEISDFLKYSELLRHDTKLHQELHSATTEELQSISLWLRLKQFFWPQYQVNFHPAHVYITLLIIVSFGFIFSISNDKEAHSVQVISLQTMRSSKPKILKNSTGQEGIVSFIYRNASPGKYYQALLIDEKGDTCFQNNNFMFNKSYLGHILIPVSDMRLGEYHLIINSKSDHKTVLEQDYIFYIFP